MLGFLDAGVLEKGELPILFDVEEVHSRQWRVPFTNKNSSDQVPRYLSTKQEIFSQVKNYLQVRVKNLSPYYTEDLGGSFRGHFLREAVDGSDSSVLAQEDFNWVRHRSGPKLGEASEIIYPRS